RICCLRLALYLPHTGKQLFVKEIISGEAVYHNRCFGLRVGSYVMPGSTADVSAYRSVKFNFFVLNPTPCGVYCGSLPVVQSVFSGPRGGNIDCAMVAAAPVLPVG